MSTDKMKAKSRTMVCDVRGSPHGVTVTGWTLSCGAVIHRSIPAGGGCGRFRDDAWTVSDPKSGYAISHGCSLGEAVDGLRDLQARWGDAFGRVIVVARACSLDRQEAHHTYHDAETPHWSTRVADWPACYWQFPSDAASYGVPLLARVIDANETVFDNAYAINCRWFLSQPDAIDRPLQNIIGWQPMEVKP